MAAFLASSRFNRSPIGYLRCNKVRDGIELDEASFYPVARQAPTIVICDFEVKHADVIGYIAKQLRARYPNAELYFAVFGAMTKDRELLVSSFDELTDAQIMHAADFEAVFVAATMSPPGIEPPLELRRPKVIHRMSSDKPLPRWPRRSSIWSGRRSASSGTSSCKPL